MTILLDTKMKLVNINFTILRSHWLFKKRIEKRILFRQTTRIS